MQLRFFVLQPQTDKSVLEEKVEKQQTSSDKMPSNVCPNESILNAISVMQIRVTLVPNLI